MKLNTCVMFTSFICYEQQVLTSEGETLNLLHSARPKSWCLILLLGYYFIYISLSAIHWFCP